MKLSSLFHRQLTSKREKFKKIFPFLWTKICLLWLKNLSVYKPDCTDYSQRISNKMAIFKLSSISIRTIDSQSSCLQLYACLHEKKWSLSFAWPWEIWIRDKTLPTACGKPTAEVAMLRLFRDKRIYSLEFEKSLQISKVIRFAAVNSEKPSQVYFWDKSQRKTKEDKNSP